MSAQGIRPILFVDVDGPLNPFAAKAIRRPAGFVTHRMRPASWISASPPGRPRRPLRVRLNPAHGAALLALPVDLVWATSWEHEANEWIGPRIGLPELPVVEWPKPASERPAGNGLFWKTPAVVEYAAGRPFAWVDDEHTPTDWRWCAERYPAPALLLPINPRFGLRDGDFATLDRWTTLLRESPGDA